jgi:hypothetical protein
MMTLTPHNAKLWAQKTFATAALGDTRRTRRLIDIAARMAQCSGNSASLSCKGNSALLEATYRFIRNDNISPEKSVVLVLNKPPSQFKTYPRS